MDARVYYIVSAFEYNFRRIFYDTVSQSVGLIVIVDKTPIYKPYILVIVVTLCAYILCDMSQ